MGHHRIRSYRLSRLAALTTLTVATLWAGSSAASAGQAHSPTSAPSPSTPLVSDVGPARSTQQFAVGRREFTFVDPSRPTQADPNRGLPAKPNRTIPVRLLYPAAGDPSLPVTNNAPPAAGSKPLVVFSHGFTATGPTYELVVLPWVRSGYTVALPTYPLTSGPGAMLADYVNQPGDVSFVINALKFVNNVGSDPLYHHIDITKLIASGHSLGAITTYGVAYHSGVRDARIDAAMPFSGAQLPFPNGNYNSRPPTPMFLAHGVQDTTLGVGLSDGMYNDATGPTSYLRLDNAGHVNLFGGNEGSLLTEGVLSFLAEHIQGEAGAQANIAAFVALTGLGEWRQK